MDFNQIGQLDYGTYLLYRRDAYIHAMQQTEAGREYLDDCWRLQQTEMDKPALRAKYGKGAQSGGQ